MEQEIKIYLQDNKQSITLPFTTIHPLDIYTDVKNLRTEITVGVSNFPAFEHSDLNPLQVIITPTVTMRLLAQALIATIDPYLVTTMDSQTLAQLDIERDELFNSIN